MQAQRQLLYIDTYNLLVPKGQLARHLYSKTDPSGVHYSKAGKIEVISKIVATLVSSDKNGTVDGINTGKRRASQSPNGASDQLKKKTIQRHEGVDSDDDSDNDAFLNSTDTAPQHSTDNV